jgi:hypothetical protein
MQGHYLNFYPFITQPLFLYNRCDRALKNAAKKWTMPIKNWSLALNQFEILCGDFRHDLLELKNTTYTK